MMKEDAINDDEMGEAEYDDLSIISVKETVNTEYEMNEADDVFSLLKSLIYSLVVRLLSVTVLKIKIGELELKLFQSDAEYRDEVKVLREKCI